MSARNIIKMKIQIHMDKAVSVILRELTEEFSPKGSELPRYQEIKLERSLENVTDILTDFINNNL